MCQWVNHHLTQAASTTLQPNRTVGCLTHADGVGGVQLAAVAAFTVEGSDHIAALPIDARAGLAFINI